MLRAPDPKISKGTPLSKAQRYLERALHFYSKKKYEQALLDLDDAIQTEPRNGEFYATRAYILVEAGYAAEAKGDLETALKRDPRQWLAHYVYGLLAYENENYEHALAHFANAQRIVPLRPEIYIYRAATYYQMGDKSKAEKEIDAALQTIPPNDTRTKLARRWMTTIKKMRKVSQESLLE